MSYLESLRRRRKTPQAAWHKLRTSIGTGKFDFFAAFEGEEDEEFYAAYFESELPGISFRPIVCDGKGGVLGLHAQMLETYGESKNVFFFVDADHDRYIEADPLPEGVFSTVGYAIENYALDHVAIMALVRKQFQLNAADPILEQISRQVEGDMMLFAAKARPIMAYAICLRARDEEIEIDNAHFSDFFRFDNMRLVKKNIDCQTIFQKIECDIKLKYSELAKSIRLVREEATECVLRGKLVSQFVISLFKQIARDYSGQTKLNGKQFSMKMELSSKNLMLKLAEVMDIPQDVVDKIQTIRTVIGR